MSPRRLAALVILLVAAGVVVVLVVVAEAPSKPSHAGGSTSSGAGTVQRRDLVDTDTESGTLSYADPQTVYNRMSGTITWLPTVGQLVKPGGTLFKVDGDPVILLDGVTPAYRDLGPGDGAGQDILQLNRNLIHLGFNPDAVVADDEWQPATTAGVDQLQASLGEPQTGTLSIGQVVFLSGDQLVSSVEAALGGNGGGSGAGNPSGVGASDPEPAAAPEYVSLQTRTPEHRARPRRTNRRRHHNARVHSLLALIALLKAEINGRKPQPDHNPGTNSPNQGGPPESSSNNPPSSGSPSSSGDGSSPTPILQTTSARLVVTVDLDASKQSEARLGGRVMVELPDGDRVPGRITAVSRVATSASNGSGNSGSTVPVTITLSGHHTGAGLDQAAVSVNFTQAVAHKVLTVPVTALLATGGGKYAVQAAAEPHKLISVTTGLFAAGNVQISGPGLYPGLQVTDSQG